MPAGTNSVAVIFMLLVQAAGLAGMKTFLHDAVMSASSVMLIVAGNGSTPGPPPVAVSWNVNDPAFSDVLQSLKTPVGPPGTVVNDGRLLGDNGFDCWVSPQAITT